MRRLALCCWCCRSLLGNSFRSRRSTASRAIYGGLVEEYKAKYALIRDRGERVIIDGICNSACTLVLGIVPLNRVCVTPRASLGFHMAYYDKADDLRRQGDELRRHRRPDVLLSGDGEGLDQPQRRAHHRMKKVKNGPALWAIVDPCPEEFF